MAAYTTITDTQVDPEAPITSELMTALRDNPIAIAEGATGAPRIDPSSAVDWDSSTNTSAEVNWVLNRTASLSLGGVGTYGVLYYNIGTLTKLNAGATVSGSILLRTSTPGNGNAFDTASSLGNTSSVAGTWRALTAAQYPQGGNYFPALFVRIA